MILVVCEHDGSKLKKNALELLGAALRLEEGVTALVMGKGAENVATEAARYAAQVLIASDAKLEPYTAKLHAHAIADLAGQAEASLVLIAGSRGGREVAPRVAVRLDAPYLEDAIALEGVEGGLRIRHYAFLARVTETLERARPSWSPRSNRTRRRWRNPGLKLGKSSRSNSSCRTAA
ncbi:MAG: hypothetical protein HC933_03035 [Pleurocapsa sp. SU_196_0]|nr:hypothetical protein [Pleurocapsa sp. SU_196_0]